MYSFHFKGFVAAIKNNIANENGRFKAVMILNYK